MSTGEWTEIALRLGAATLAGGAIGLNRDLHGKPIGLRTLGLVGLATALAVIVAEGPAQLMDGHIERLTDATSRVIQGILTGIGFLGAGVILRPNHHGRIRGLTSAACVWFTACVGVACGAGWWALTLIALGFALVLLVTGGPVERTLHRLLGETAKPAQPHPLPPGDALEKDQSGSGPHQPGK